MSFAPKKKPLVLCICDGFGCSDSDNGNAISAAKTPNIDELWVKNPHTRISASGADVGLPCGQMGNSEVGHTNIGAGRIVYQDLSRITSAIADASFFQNPVLLNAMHHAKSHALHLMGLFSDGGVHSHINHLFALLDMAKAEGVTQVYVHCFTDGRDVSPTSGAGLLQRLEEKLQALGTGQIGTVVGRYYAMDRDNRWQRTGRAYNALLCHDTPYITNQLPSAYVQAQYAQNITDEFIEPVTFINTPIQKDDSVIFYNFRPDRARQLTRAFVDPSFTGFERINGYFPLTYVCLTEYDATMPNVAVAFPPENLTNTFGELLAVKGLAQLRIAETEKYPHVTFFFNGGIETPFAGEERVLIPSPKVATYDLQPEMSAYKVTHTLLKNLAKFDVVILNFANCDMVGHTGDFAAAVKATETVDTCVKDIVNATLKLGGKVLITADHGNAEQMTDENGNPFTAHTTNLVPFILCGADDSVSLRQTGGKLCDIAPTMLDLLGIPKPAEMTGESLLETK